MTAFRSIDFFVTVIVVVPNGLLQSWQVNRLMNIELSFHVKDNSSGSQSLLNDVGQYLSFNHEKAGKIF